MNDADLLDTIKKNILGLSWSLQDAPFHGVSKESEKAIKFSIDKILKGTGITIESLLKENENNDWFKI